MVFCSPWVLTLYSSLVQWFPNWDPQSFMGARRVFARTREAAEAGNL